MKATFKLFLGLVAVGAVSGCTCERRGSTGGARGEIGVLYGEPVQTAGPGAEAVYDFGAVFMGQRSETVKLTVRNMGAGILGVEKLEKLEGAPVKIAELEEPNAAFEVAFSSKDLGVGETFEWEMTFLAPNNDVEKVVDHEVRLLLRANNTVPEQDTAVVILRGRAVSGVCELPRVLDFGSVAKNDSFKMSVEIKNPTQLEAAAFAGDVYSSSGDHQAFGYSLDSPRGTVIVPPGQKKTVSLVFTPTEIKSYLAFVKLRASAQCPEYPVKLIGQGVDNVLIWSCNGKWDTTREAECNFGYVTPGAGVEKELTFRNAGNADANLSQIKASSGEFKVLAEPGQDPTKLAVPGKNGEAKVKLSFKPTVLGPRSAILSFVSNLPKQANGAVQLRGYGGGPDIQVVPAPTLNFGKVAYFPTASPPSYQTRKLTVMNVGTKPVVPDPSANLKLGVKGAGQPYWEIKSLNANSDLAEISIAVPPTTGRNAYDPAVGLEASAGKNLVALEVKITPASATVKEYEVKVFSNDPDEPETVVKVTADVQVLPPCNYTVSPTALNFGLVSPPQYRDLGFQIKNLGQNAGDICLLSSLDMAAGSDAIFTLPAGTVDSKELQPGETMTVTVRAWPQGAPPTTPTPQMGNVQFFMSSPNVPQKLIRLDAMVATGCLTIAPDDVDFGTVQKSCNSSTRTFSVYNTCASPVTINSFAMQAAAGQPAGGPDCPGTTPCPEFHTVSSLATPVTLTSGQTPITFSAKYKPIDMGPDTGAIAIGATHGGQNVTYIVTLAGKGDTVGLNTDVFTQDSKPKADIFMVIDNSCSMSDEQTSLATNFGSFIKYAVSAGVDYQIGVTTTDMNNPSHSGRLLGDANNPKVLRPSTPDVENKFKTKVQLGTSGSGWEKGFEPALAGLTAPLVTTDNAGFLRHEAALAVVVVTDEMEQSSQTVPYWYNQFMNIKGFKRANQFTFNAIAGFVAPLPSGCSYDPDDGRYAQMVTLTSGVKENICTPNWSKSLEQLGKTAFGYRTNFYLNGVPDLTGGKAITVKIDGVVIPEKDPRNAQVWTYDSVANSVNFEPMYVPEPGQTMTITYYVACF